MLIGYARTSTVEQVAGLEAQEVALGATGCSKLFAEQASSVAQRDQLDAALDWVLCCAASMRENGGRHGITEP